MAHKLVYLMMKLEVRTSGYDKLIAPIINTNLNGLKATISVLNFQTLKKSSSLVNLVHG